ncbi:MAG: hypothetical protein F2658_02245 [Actinobacteria bacterium]|uniref:Unannotated protein n=1 Tax=freshwater metagenome TaxID=449393 RepID=A0A6J6N9Z8_9ZZZZ|nr:hypothetical protein [Actinomycetota bacterium]
MRKKVAKLFDPITRRRAWIRRVLVASAAAATSWIVGDQLVPNGGLVAAIVCALSIRISIYKSVREGFGQLIGTAIGASIALLTVHLFSFGFIAVGTTVLLCSVVARALRLGEVASVNVPVTALIVLGPGLSESTAVHRLSSTLIGALIAIAFSYFSHAKTPAGRTIDQIARIGKKSADLLIEMSEGYASSFNQKQAGTWLVKARLLVEEIPDLRSQAIEAREYAKWSPLSEEEVADSLYINGVAVEHMVVQVRTIARRIFDASQDKQRVTTVDRAIAHALSATSVAISEKIELIKRPDDDHEDGAIAKELQVVADNLTEELILRNQQIPRDQFVRCMSLVSAITIIAASLDESSPALLNVKTPEDPSSQPIMGYAPITKTTKLSRRVWISVRKFLRR